jgi:threonine/homoserine/homoserine lactone efflux protein
VDAAFLDVVTRGTVLGLAAGFSPGPLTLLVISETLRHGLGAGVRVSLAPLLTDLPLIALSVLLLDRLASVPAAAGVIALAGATFLFHMGVGSLRIKAVAAAPAEAAARALMKGVVANFLNPNPYVFWIGVGTPILLSAFGHSWVHAASFAGAFFVCIVAAKILLARMVDRSRGFLKGRVYLWTMRVLGILLIVYGCLFLREGLLTMGVWPAAGTAGPGLRG